MKRVVTIMLGFLGMRCLDSAPLAGDGGPTPPMIYELYSWQQPLGAWNFSVLRNTSSEKTVQQVFTEKTRLRGVDAVKRKFAQLPAGSTVVWVVRLPTDGSHPKAIGSERLAYPPPEIVTEVRNAVGARNITLETPPYAN